MPASLASFPSASRAVVIGASGGIGAALTEALAASGQFGEVISLSRRENSIDVTGEGSIAAAAAKIVGLA